MGHLSATGTSSTSKELLLMGMGSGTRPRWSSAAIAASLGILLVSSFCLRFLKWFSTEPCADSPLQDYVPFFEAGLKNITTTLEKQGKLLGRSTTPYTVNNTASSWFLKDDLHQYKGLTSFWNPCMMSFGYQNNTLYAVPIRYTYVYMGSCILERNFDRLERIFLLFITFSTVL